LFAGFIQQASKQQQQKGTFEWSGWLFTITKRILLLFFCCYCSSSSKKASKPSSQPARAVVKDLFVLFAFFLLLAAAAAAKQASKMHLARKKGKFKRLVGKIFFHVGSAC